VLDDSLPMLKDTLALAAHWKKEYEHQYDGLLEIDPNRKSPHKWSIIHSMEEMCPRLPDMLGVINDTLMTHGFEQIVNSEFKEVIERLKPVAVNH